jgi:tight adherence protein C
MIEILEIAQNKMWLAKIFAALAVSATIVTLAMPLIFHDPLPRRMRQVAFEREKIRQRARRGPHAPVSLRQSPKQYMQQAVERFNLRKWLGQDDDRLKLIQAGYRGEAPFIAYLFFRMLTPALTLLATTVYVFVVFGSALPLIVKLGLCILAVYAGLHLPWLYLKNRITKRQLAIRRAFPDALDLVLICVESGMSIETAFHKVAQEIGGQSVPLAEEFALTNAELSYLEERRLAYDNFAKRTGLEHVRAVCLALQQAERYGTPLGQTLRVLAEENRDMRMAEAERKAAALPPKLTVPMIVFFLPVLFVVILGPAAIRVMGL